MIFIFLYVYNIDIQIGIKKRDARKHPNTSKHKANADTKFNS